MKGVSITATVIIVIVAIALVVIFFTQHFFSISTQPGVQNGVYTNPYSYTSPDQTTVIPGTPINTNTGGGAGDSTGTSTNTGGTQGTSSVQVAIAGGRAITTSDFKSDPQTETSTNIPGHYYLAGGLDPVGSGAPYSIFYVDSDQSFTIDLLQEPLSQTRQDAEQVLMKKLGITTTYMCELRYTVLVPVSVNSFYSGKNLGFSFCPGAVVLP